MPKITEPKKVAGGIPAILSTIKFLISQTGLFRGVQILRKMNQVDGFDCPGCAWPEPEKRSVTEFCENGAKAIAEEGTTRSVDKAFFEAHSFKELSEKSEYWLSQKGRITHPMIYRKSDTHYRPISWGEAFSLMAQHLKSTDPNRAVFYTSGRTSNEAAFLYQLFIRKYGTNNLPDCSNLCHESSGVALSESIGSGKGTVSLKDFDSADLLFVVGQNPGTNHPRMLSTLQEAAKRGARIVSVNPLFETGLSKFKHPQQVFRLFGRGSSIATHSFPVRINGDVAFFKGMIKALLEWGTFDRKFIDEYTEGFEAYRKHVDETSWTELVTSSGIPESKIREAAGLYKEAKATICCWAMGLTQHKNAVSNIQEIVNFLLLKGNFGRPGAGACPVRGHSNVQGDRTMGIYEKPSPAFLSALEKEFAFKPPQKHGYDVVDSIRAMANGLVDVFFAMGGNFVSASPDTLLTERALSRCKITTHVSTKLNRSHFVTGEIGLILPCLGRTEQDKTETGFQFVSVEDSMGVVHLSQGHLKPHSPELLSEAKIVAELATATLGKDLDFNSFAQNYDHIRDSISRVIPGFEDFNRRIRKRGGFILPHAVRDELKFSTTSKKARFTVHPVPKWDLKKGEYLLMTVRSHDQYNTTIYGLDDRYRGVYQGRRILFINKKDREEASFSKGASVTLKSMFDGTTRKAEGFSLVDYEIPRGCLASYFPETNVLVPLENFADKSQTPVSKSIVVTLQ